MDIKEEYRDIYRSLSAEQKKAFRDALENGDKEKIMALCGASEEPKPQKKRKSGRPNLGLTDKHQEEYNQYRKDIRNAIRVNAFPQEMVERVEGEIVSEDDAEQFKELYKLTCYSVLEQFKADNEELVKKHPYNWYKKVLIRIKEQTPKIERSDLDKLQAIWDVLKVFMSDIGLYITYETFQNMADVYDYQLVKMAELNPKYRDFREKIFFERDVALVDELQHNPYNQTNKIFIAKCHGIIEKTEQKTIEVVHSAKRLDDIPIFAIEDQNENH